MQYELLSKQDYFVCGNCQGDSQVYQEKRKQTQNRKPKKPKKCKG